jgi:hypothetical protein
MNHNVRNALQVISYSAPAQPDEKLAGMGRAEVVGGSLEFILQIVPFNLPTSRLSASRTEAGR